MWIVYMCNYDHVKCIYEIRKRVTYAESTNNKFLIVFVGARIPEFRKGSRCRHLRCIERVTVWVKIYIYIFMCVWLYVCTTKLSDSQKPSLAKQSSASVEDNMCVICLECAVNSLSVHRRAVRQPYTFSKDSISLTN